MVTTLSTETTRSTRHPSRGRPRADASRLIGYKLKVGAKYAKEDKRRKSGIRLVGTMGEGSVFTTKKAVTEAKTLLVSTGQVTPWGGKIRAQVLPRYS